MAPAEGAEAEARARGGGCAGAASSFASICKHETPGIAELRRALVDNRAHTRTRTVPECCTASNRSSSEASLDAGSPARRRWVRSVCQEAADENQGLNECGTSWEGCEAPNGCTGRVLNPFGDEWWSSMRRWGVEGRATFFRRGEQEEGEIEPSHALASRRTRSPTWRYISTKLHTAASRTCEKNRRE